MLWGSSGANSSGCSIARGVLMGSLHVGRVWSALPDAARAASMRLLCRGKGAGAEGDDVKEPAGHHQVLVEVYHVVLISGRQMHAKSSAKADQGKQSSGPSAVETRQQGQAAEQMHRYRDPDGDARGGYMNTGEILRRAAWIAKHYDGVPDE